MSAISFSGLVTGLDTDSWVSALTALKNAKVQQLEEEKSEVVALKDVVAGIKSYFTSFRSSLERLTDAKFGTDSLDLFVQNLANSSNPAKVTATATPDAARDTYEVGVSQVASTTKVNTAVRTTVSVTATADLKTKLSVLGVKEGYVSLNNKEIQIVNSDTIESLLEKLNDIGINADYDEDKGRFTIADDITQADDGVTELFDSLGLSFKAVEGFQSNQLMTEGYVTIKASTLLTDIGVKNGAININQSVVNLNFNSNATVQTFLDYINTNYGSTGANASMDAEGIITITGIDIKEIDGESNILTALGLVEKVDSVTSSSDGLLYTKNEVITENTRLGDINTTYKNYNLVLGNGTTQKTVTMSATSSIKDVFNQIKSYASSNGMTAEIEVDSDGVISISGDIDNLYLSGGVIEGLGLEMESVNGTKLTSSALSYTSTLTASTSTTFGELGIKGTNLNYSVLNDRAEVIQNNLTVTENTTIEQWFNSLKQYGITGSISEDGVISIDGDALVSGNLATALGLSYVLSGSEVSGTTAISNQLKGTTTTTATMTDSLASIGITGNQVITIKNGATTVVKTFTTSSTLQDVANAISSAGGTMTIDKDGFVSITGVDKLSGSLVTSLNLDEHTVNGTSLYNSNLKYTISYVATESSKLSDLGINSGVASICNEYGEVLANVTLSANNTLGDFISALEDEGLTAGINENGQIIISGGIVKGTLADALGIKYKANSTVVSKTTLVSNNLVGSQTTSATLSSTLGSLGFNGNYSLSVNGSNYNFTANSTLNDIKNAITAKGGTFSLDDGKINISNINSLSGSLATALELDPNVVNGTTIYSTKVSYVSGNIATTDSKFSDFGISPSGKSFNIYDSKGDLIVSGVTLSANATVGDFISTLESYGLSASISESGSISISNGVIDGTFATALGITKKSYLTVLDNKTLVSSSITATVSTTATLSTTLSQLGVSGTQYLTINYNGTVSGFNFSGSSTIADIKDAVVSAGGTFDIKDGYISISGVALSGSLATNLGLNKQAGNINTYVTQKVEFTVNTITITTTATATAITTSTAIVTVTSIATTTAKVTVTSVATTTAITTVTSIATTTAKVTVTSIATTTAISTVTSVATTTAKVTVTSIATTTAISTVTSVATTTAISTVTSVATTTAISTVTSVATSTAVVTVTSVSTSTAIVTVTSVSTSTAIVTLTSVATSTISTTQIITNTLSVTDTTTLGELVKGKEYFTISFEADLVNPMGGSRHTTIISFTLAASASIGDMMSLICDSLLDLGWDAGIAPYIESSGMSFVFRLFNHPMALGDYYFSGDLAGIFDGTGNSGTVVLSSTTKTTSTNVLSVMGEMCFNLSYDGSMRGAQAGDVITKVESAKEGSPILNTGTYCVTDNIRNKQIFFTVTSSTTLQDLMNFFKNSLGASVTLKTAATSSSLIIGNFNSSKYSFVSWGSLMDALHSYNYTKTENTTTTYTMAGVTGSFTISNKYVTETITTTTTSLQTTTTTKTVTSSNTMIVTKTVSTTTTVTATKTTTTTKTVTATKTATTTKTVTATKTTTTTKTVTATKTTSTTKTVTATKTTTTTKTVTATKTTSTTQTVTATKTTTTTKTVTATKTTSTTKTVTATKTTTATTTVVKTDTEITSSTRIVTTTETTTSTYIDSITKNVTMTDTGSLVYRTGQKTFLTASTNFSSADTKLSQIGITNGTVNLKNNKTGATTAIFTVTSSSTLSDFLAALNANGFEAKFADGRVTINTDEDLTLQNGTSNLITKMNFTTSSESYTLFQNSTSNTLDNRKTVTLTASSSIGNFTDSLEDRILTVTIDGTTYAKTFSTTNTVADIMSYLGSLGITASLNNGTFNASSSDFEFALSGNLTDVILGENPTFTTTTKTASWSATVGMSTNGVAINGNTKLVHLGVTEGSIKIYDNGTWITRAFNITADTTIDDFISALNGFGFNAELKNGKLNITADSDKYLVNESSNLVSQLGLTKTNSYKTVFESTTSKELGYSKVYTIKADTTVKDLGFNNSAELRVSIDGTMYSLSFGENESMQDVINTLKVYGINAGFNNGTFTASSTEHTFTLGGELGKMLTSANPVTNTITTVTGYTGQLDDSVKNVVINGDTKLVDLGVSTGGLKVYDNGTWINTAISINDNTTINDFLSALRGYDFDAKLENGKITISSDSDKYIMDEASNLVSKLGLTTRTNTNANLYEQTNSKVLTVVTTFTTGETTSLKDLGFDSGASLRIEIDGVVQTIGFSADETVEDIIDSLASLGIEASIKNGTFTATSTSKTFKLTGTLADALNGKAPTYIQTEKVLSYVSDVNTTDVEYTANRDTKITDLGVSTGYINVLKNGEITASIAIEDNTTVAQLFNALSAYNIAASIDSNGVITIESVGDVTLKDGTSNLVTQWGLDDNIVKATYNGTTMVLEDEVFVADEDTLVSYFDTADKKAKGSIYLSLYDQDGNLSNAVVNIEEGDTIGDVIEKFAKVGVTAYFEDGVITLHNGLGSLQVTGGSSNLFDNLKLQIDDVEQWMQNDDAIEVTRDEVRYLSIVNYADKSTTLETLGVTSGDVSIGINGAVVNVYVDETDTLQNVISKISTATKGSVTASLTSDGKFTLEAAEGVELFVGTSTDTTNLATVFNLAANGSNKIVGGTSLYKASAGSKITESGIFRLGDVTEGTFVIGNAEFTITSETTIANLVNEINRNEDANASAYWDNINGKLVINSNTLGASYVNIQSGTSNIAEIFGLVTNDNGIERLATYNQDLGDNAIVTINGTRIVATSNTITSDVSRIEGLTVNIKDVTEGEYVTITVERDTQGIIDAVQETLDAYNTLIAELTSALSVSGDLHGDTALSGLKNQITSILTSKGTNGTTKFRNLAAVGISTESASTALTADIYSLYLDPEKFTKALDESENDVKLLLVGTVDNPGIFTRVETLIENMLSTSGYFSTKTNALNREINSYDSKIAKAEAQVDFYKSMLERKFSNMELLYSNMQSAYSHLFSSVA